MRSRHLDIGLPLVLLLTAMVMPGSSSGQVAIYDLTFQRSEEQSINVAFFDGGYLALDLVTGTGSLLFTFKNVKDGLLQPCFVRAAEAADAFTAVRGAERKTVIRATSQNATAMAHYLATGLVDHQIATKTGGVPLQVDIASRLSGHVLASDDESDVEFAPGESVIAFAGTASLELTLNPDLTGQANRTGETLAEALETLTRQLILIGFHEAGLR